MKRALVYCIVFLFTWFPLISFAQGTWIPIASQAPDPNGGVMLLLTDGSVICKSFSGGTDGSGTIWNKLTPDAHGSYVNGTWSTIAEMPNSRLYFPSSVLRDGRVFVAGGEYGTGSNYSEIYDPVSDSWTDTHAPNTNIGDANSAVLPDGRIMVGQLDFFSPLPALDSTNYYNPNNNTWARGPITIGTHDETSWIKLPDNSILFVDRSSFNSERFIPSLGHWIADANVPTDLYDQIIGETGPGILLPNGKALFIGGTGHTAIYTPSGNNTLGSWVAGPDIPIGYVSADAPAAMMANGKVLFTASPISPDQVNIFPSPTAFFEYNYISNTISQVAGPGGVDTISEPSYVTNMLDLPDGTVLYGDFDNYQYYVYSPDGAPLAAGKPTVSSVTSTGCHSFTATGTLFNGISEGAYYGDDWQMATNYPIVRLTSGTDVYYARTYNWNRLGVQTGSLPDTTQFDVPTNLPAGTYSLVVVANGISSNPFSFTYAPATAALSSPLNPPAVCTNTAFTYAPTSNTGGVTFSWTRAAVSGLNNGAITVPQTNNPNEVLVNNSTSPVIVTYNYQITANGCTNIQQVTVVVNPQPAAAVINANGNTTLCIGDSVVLQGNSASGTWSVGGSTSTTLVATATGDYYVINTNACGSTNSNHITVTQNQFTKPTVTFSGWPNDTVCRSASPLTLNGNPAGGNFSGIGMSGTSFISSALPVGWTKVSYSYTDAHGCSNSFKDSAYVAICSGINTLESASPAFVTYPNPASEILLIKGSETADENFVFRLCNTAGQTLRTLEIKSQNNSLETKLDIKELSSGVYFLLIGSDKTNQVIKIQKL